MANQKDSEKLPRYNSGKDFRNYNTIYGGPPEEQQQFLPQGGRLPIEGGTFDDKSATLSGFADPVDWKEVDDLPGLYPRGIEYWLARYISLQGKK